MAVLAVAAGAVALLVVDLIWAFAVAPRHPGGFRPSGRPR